MTINLARLKVMLVTGLSIDGDRSMLTSRQCLSCILGRCTSLDKTSGGQYVTSITLPHGMLYGAVYDETVNK